LDNMIVKVAAVAAAEPVFSWYIYQQQNNFSFQDFRLLGHDAVYIGVYIPLFWSTLLSQDYVSIFVYAEVGGPSFSKTLVPILQSTECHHITPENLNIHLYQLQILHTLSFLASKHLSNCMSYEIIISYLSNI
jgi:hypothetical protein